MEKPSKIKIDFEREGKNYSAIFAVAREQNGTTYNMHAQVFDSKGKQLFEKSRNGLDYSQVEYALTFVFHQAFVENV